MTGCKATAGVVAAPIVWSSLFTLATTGCGLPGELAGTAEGFGYVVVAGFAAVSLANRATGGSGLAAAEREEAAAEMAALEAANASDERVRFSARKVADLESGPYLQLLTAAEALSVLTAVAALVVFGAQLALYGSLPSALPGTACYG